MSDAETEAPGVAPAGCLDVYECLPRCTWVGIERDEAGATITIQVGGRSLRFWSPSVQLPSRLVRGEIVSVLATQRGLDIRSVKPHDQE